MKYSLLKLTQKVLSSLSSDEINSIGDTVEAQQVVDIIEDVYYNLVENNNIPEHKGLIKVEALGDTSHPNYLKIPDHVSKIELVHYNKSLDVSASLEYTPIPFVEPEVFLNRNISIDTTDSNISIIQDFNGVKLAIKTDTMPEYWTTFDDNYMVFNAYDSSVDSTLQDSKTMVMGVTTPTFTRSDTFYLDIDDNVFPLLLNEVKSWAYLELKQTGHAKAEQYAKRQRDRLQAEGRKVTVPYPRPDYGRR